VLSSTPITPSNHWRRRYTRPETVHSIGTAAAALLRDAGKNSKKGQKARIAQQELMRASGFAGGNAELGHRVVYEMRAAGYSETVAQFAGHLCAVAGAWNFQGNWRIAKLMGRSLRTVQRARALLERDGLVHSHLLEPGDMIDGQRAPVLRHQVVRYVAPLQRMAFKSEWARKTPHQRSGKRKRGEKPTPAPAPERVAPISAEQLDHVASLAPDWLAPIIGAAAAGKRAADAGGSRPAAELGDVWVPDLSSHRGRMSAAELDAHLAQRAQRRPIDEQQPTRPPSDRELDELDAELERESRRLAEPRPPDE